MTEPTHGPHIGKLRTPLYVRIGDDEVSVGDLTWTADPDGQMSIDHATLAAGLREAADTIDHAAAGLKLVRLQPGDVLITEGLEWVDRDSLVAQFRDVFKGPGSLVIMPKRVAYTINRGPQDTTQPGWYDRGGQLAPAAFAHNDTTEPRQVD